MRFTLAEAVKLQNNVKGIKDSNSPELPVIKKPRKKKPASKGVTRTEVIGNEINFYYE